MIRFCVLVCFLFCIVVPTACAVSDVFTVRTQIGGDSVAPSTPTLLSATPVSASQIDLAWSTSTDNFLLAGYKVYRDNIHIATTTLTSYSDSGLTQNTLYSYSVVSFDNSLNISSTSNAIATKTLSTVNPTATPVSTQSSSKNLSLQSFAVFPKIHSVDFNWNTNIKSSFELRWGRTTSYELGFISNVLLRKSHNTNITGLEAGTVYQFELSGFTPTGKRILLRNGSFSTSPANDIVAPSNVRIVSAYSVGDGVHLSWLNPDDSDFAGVRVVRNHLFYPAHRSDGFLVFEGDSTSFNDRHAFLEKNAQYYTVFAYDTQGNVSSGAVVMLTRAGFVMSEDGESPSISLDSDPYMLDFNFLEFLQNDVLVDAKSLLTNVPFRVRIAYEHLPEHLKTVTLQFEYSDSHRETYLLKINPTQTYYESSLPGFTVQGGIPAVLAMYDFEAKHVQKSKGLVVFRPVSTRVVETLLPIHVTLAVPSEVVTFVFFSFIFFLVAFLYVLLFRNKNNA